MVQNYEGCKDCKKTGFDIKYCLMVLKGEAKELLERGPSNFCDEVKIKGNLEGLALSKHN